MEFIRTFADAHPLNASKAFKYGTAGFRDEHTVLTEVFARVGLFAAIRSRAAQSQLIGVMVTASHNPEEDNGVKIVDPNGGMLSAAWEPWTEKLGNARTSNDVTTIITEICAHFNIATENCSGRVLIGYDTRPHSRPLAALVAEGVRAAGAEASFLGEVTTPQLHFAVKRCNEAKEYAHLASEAGCAAELEKYYESLCKGYESLLSTCSSSTSYQSKMRVPVDCARGVGTNGVRAFAARLSHAVELQVLNAAHDGRGGKVNDGCGAEHVQKSQLPPSGLVAEDNEGLTCCSLDGDADRIVFQTFHRAADAEAQLQWALLDGDKIASLIAMFLRREIDAAGLARDVSFGMVQTAYANGASTAFLRAQGVPVRFAKTGVKFVHAAAHEFDCGVYFEANGHGTVLFSDKFIGALQDKMKLQQHDAGDAADGRAGIALRRLQACTEVINQAVGDALSDMLMVLAILQVSQMAFQ